MGGGSGERSVLVTGATGFLGSRVAARLAARGDRVRALVRATSDLGRLRGVPVERVEGDVTDAASVARAAEGVDSVFHTAALLEFGADPERMRLVNVEGTRNVLEAGARVGALVVHVSSLAALGPTPTRPVDESWWNPVEPTVGYEVTKRAAHRLARRHAAEGARVRIAVPGGIYGYGDRSSMARLIELFVRFPNPVGYLPDLVQSLVQVDDCAAGLVLVEERGVDGGEYVLAAEAVTFRTWFEAIAAGAGRRPPVAYVPTALVRWSRRPACAVARWLGRDAGELGDTMDLATRSLAFSGARARSELGWSPRPLDQGMAEMAAAIRAARPPRRPRRGRAPLGGVSPGR